MLNTLRKYKPKSNVQPLPKFIPSPDLQNSEDIPLNIRFSYLKREKSIKRSRKPRKFVKSTRSRTVSSKSRKPISKRSVSRKPVSRKRRSRINFSKKRKRSSSRYSR